MKERGEETPEGDFPSGQKAAGGLAGEGEGEG